MTNDEFILHPIPIGVSFEELVGLLDKNIDILEKKHQTTHRESIMKIKSTIEHNVSFHKVPQSTMKGVADYLTIPAGSTLELDDETWLDAFASSDALQSSIRSGSLILVEDAASPLSVEEILELLREKAGIAANPELSKPELQNLAHRLGVSLQVPVDKQEDEE